mmetsp:Transcript_37683/g.120135  ORF Transcript_37683/g.120135 Transcript_37683/m.120135 type:complete len:99 (+) Transcript_37683:1427-1723(+)
MMRITMMLMLIRSQATFVPPLFSAIGAARTKTKMSTDVRGQFFGLCQYLTIFQSPESRAVGSFAGSARGPELLGRKTNEVVLMCCSPPPGTSAVQRSS